MNAANLMRRPGSGRTEAAIFRSRSWPALLAIVTFFGFVGFQSSVPILSYEINADSIYVLAITKDILFNGGHLSDWMIAPHLFLYPDVPLAMIVLIMQQAGIPVFTACVAVYGALLAALLAYVWRRTTGAPIGQCILSGVLLTGIFYCGDYLLYLLTFREASTPDLLKALDHLYSFGHVLGPTPHSGAFLVACATLIPLYSVMTRASISGRRAALLMAFISCNVFLTTLSDLIFAAWGVIPLSVATVALMIQGSRRRALLLLALIWASAALGYLTSRLIGDEIRTAYFLSTRGTFAVAVQGLIALAKLAVSFAQPVITLFLAANLALWAAAVRCMYLELSSSSSSFARTITIFAASMSTASILAAVATGLFTGDQVRYFIPYMVLGPVFCAVAMMRGLFSVLSFASWSAGLSIGGAAIFAAGAIAWYSLPGPAAVTLYGCLQREGLMSGSGRAGFWDAAPVAAASGWRVKVVPLSPGTLDIYLSLANRQWLRSESNQGDRNFLILSPEIAAMALHRYGPADRIIPCARREILVYRHAPWGETGASRLDAIR
jgi:hypothetical protein